MEFREGDKNKFCFPERKVGAEYLFEAGYKGFFKEFGMPGKALERK